MNLEILNSDLFFNDSPDSGEPSCICSRCHKQIEEDEVVLRVAVDGNNLYSKNSNEKKQNIDAADGYEFRLCEECQKVFLK